MHPHKCATWSPFSLLPTFDTPSKGIKVLGVPLGTSSFTSSFIKDVLLEDAWHVYFLPIMGDVQVAFGFLTHYLCNDHHIYYDAHFHFPFS